MTGNIDVVVVGGGYAGVMAANRLTQRDDAAVTLINPRRTFVERIRLHQVVGGSDDAVVDYREVLAEGVRLVADTVTRIDAAERSVTLAAGGTVGYDYLIYAVGSGSADPGVPGVAEFAYPIASLEEAQRLRPVVDAAPATAPVTVVGAGPTGIEAAAELAEAGRAVTLVCGRVLGPYLHARGAHAADTVLARIAGEQPAPINLGFFGQCISLGRRAGIFQFASKDDTANGLYIGGGSGAKLKEFVCERTVKHLADEARKPGSLTWVKDDKRQELLRAKRREALTVR